MSWLGLDIGGANIKFASSNGVTTESSFPMWSQHEQLSEELSTLLQDVSEECDLAVTMTGELADGFEDKRYGVGAIVESVVCAARKRQVRFYRTDGQWCEPKAALIEPLYVAASNWHALATYAGRFLPAGGGFLFDIGSTTTDIIPVKNGVPFSRCDQPITDFKRLVESQLIYTGVWRSPVNGFVRQIDVGTGQVSLANELFATVADAYIWMELVPEDEHNHNTADSRPATREHSGQRLARMLCSDRDEIKNETIDEIARAAADENFNRVAAALTRVVSAYSDLPHTFVVTGSGSWLAEQVLEHVIQSDRLSICRPPEFAKGSNRTGAAAFAVMKLANEQLVEPET